MKNLLPLCFGILFLFSARAQEQLGLRTEYQAGINGIALNPAAPLTAPFAWQVNFFEGAFFFANNYGYLDRTSLNDLRRRAENLNFLYGPNLGRDEQAGPDDLLFYPNEKDGNRFANLTTSAMGPSFFIRYGPGHSVGITTRARTMVSANRVSATLSSDRLNAQPYFEAFSADPLYGGALSWTEIGLNAVFSIPSATGSWGVGITGKYLTGFEAGYLYMDEVFELTKLPGDSLIFSPFAGSAGYTTSNLSGDNFDLTPNGTGFGIDLGLIYTDEGEGEAPYRWRLGVSLLDLGGIRFDRNTRTHRFETTNPSEIAPEPYEQLQGVESLDTIFQIFSRQTLGTPQASLQTESSFFMWLPSAVSLQVDRAFSPSLFLNATLVQGLPLGSAGVSRGSLFALTPRWESRWWGLAAPVSIYNWKKLNLGLGLRLGFLYLGTEQLGSLLMRSEFSGADFYFALRFQPWWSGGAAKRSPRMSRKRGRAVDCYQF